MSTSRQLYFEEVNIGDEIPALVKEELTTKTFVKWAAAVRDFYPVHYDTDFAKNLGLRGVIAHGPYKLALLARLMREWMGEQGELLKLDCQHRGSNYAGETLICRGRVTNKYVQEPQNLVECEVWVENQEGDVSAPGSAVVALPSTDAGTK
jgi:acyl dehydratase